MVIPMKAWILVSLIACANASQAGLGGLPAELGPQSAASRANGVSTGLATYTDVERKLDSGTTIHEYLDAGGTVFAVSWSGPFLPDLRAILGRHFDTLVAHAAGRPGAGRSALRLERADVVIISGGHMRAFEGRAWLPAAAEEVRPLP